MLVVCNKCSIVFEAISIDKVNKTCPTCANPQDIDIDEIDLTKSYDENLKDFFTLVREQKEKE